MIIFEPFFNAAKECFLMYTNGSYLAKQVMQVPEELILRKDVSELLPVPATTHINFLLRRGYFW